MKKQKTNIEKIKQINKKRRKPKTIKRNEIRRNLLKEAQKHPAYLMSIKGENGTIVGLTHAEKTQGVKNVKLPYNPNKKDKRTTYARPFTKDIPMTKLSQPYKDWKMSKESKKVAKKIKKQKKK